MFFVDRTSKNNSRLQCCTLAHMSSALRVFKNTKTLLALWYLFKLAGLFSWLRIKLGSRHLNNLLNFKLRQSNFAKCLFALKLSWPRISSVRLNSVSESCDNKYSVRCYGPEHLYPFSQDYDKTEEEEGVFPCFWGQEANFFARTSLLNGGLTLTPPSSWLDHHQNHTKPGSVHLPLNLTFSFPFAAFSISSLVLVRPSPWECWKGLDTLFHLPCKDTVSAVIRYPFRSP